MGGGPSRTLSTSSVQSLAELLINTAPQLAATEVEVVREEGLRHAKVRLEAR
jgi:choline kinase